MTSHLGPKPRPTARVSWNNRVQIVSIPADFRFSEAVREVFIRREAHSIILTPRPSDWSGVFEPGKKASAVFIADIERLPVQERSF